MSGFLDTAGRFLGLDDRQADPDAAQVVVVPVPFERTSSYGRGSAGGPAAILEASREVELYDTELGFEPWSIAGGIATLSPMAIDPTDDGAAVCKRLTGIVDEWRDRGKMVVTLAGEHTGVVGAIRSYARRSQGLTVVQIDAHSDLRESYQGDPWNHACTMARVLEFHRGVVQVGIRSESAEDRMLARRHRIPVFRGAMIQQAAARRDDWIAPIIDACEESVYVTFDCDGLDPSVIPATGTPEPGGLTWLQVNELLDRLCRARRVVGFDISELAPIPGLSHPQFTIAKLAARLMAWSRAAAGRPRVSAVAKATAVAPAERSG